MNLTVIIPTRNRSKLLNTLVTNLVINFNFIDQIIIVDSSDNIDKNARFSDFKNVLHVHTKIKSAAVQRNIGLDLVKSNCKFVSFLDDDVNPPPNYFTQLTSLLMSQKAVGVSGIAENPKSLNLKKINQIFHSYRNFFFLDSNNQGKVLNSGVNIPVKKSLMGKSIIESQWLIGCAIWDFQKIKSLRFDNRFTGQSLGEDVLFSIKASKYGKLFVKQNLTLTHFESSTNRPNYLMYTRMWVRNRFYIVEEILGDKMKIAYHWCNFGRFLTLIFFAPRHPINFLFGLTGIYLGYYDLVKDKYAR